MVHCIFWQWFTAVYLTPAKFICILIPANYLYNIQYCLGFTWICPPASILLICLDHCQMRESWFCGDEEFYLQVVEWNSVWPWSGYFLLFWRWNYFGFPVGFCVRVMFLVFICSFGYGFLCFFYGLLFFGIHSYLMCFGLFCW